MRLLALDTSTRQASLSLSTEDELLGEYTWRVDNNHSVELLERIQRLCAECATTMQELDGVAVATGPGSFNGLRVALATAKALAFALKKPIIGISTLELIAAQQRQWEGTICAVLEAGRAELYFACYTFDKAVREDGEVAYLPRQRGDYALMSPQQISDFLQAQMPEQEESTGKQAPYLFCGEISQTSRATLHSLLQEKCIFGQPLLAARHASILAMLAFQRFHAGKVDDPLLLEPLYLRRPSITTSTRKQPLLGGKQNRSTGQSPTGLSKTEREEGALRH